MTQEQLIDTSGMSLRQKKRLIGLLEKKQEIRKYGGHLNKIFPDEGPLCYKNYPRHMEFFKSGALYKERLFLAANRVGKFCRVDERVLTPSGWNRLGDLIIGSEVLGPNGETAKVTGIYDQGMQDFYRVHFNDGTHVDCGLPHLWKCKGYRQRFRKTYTSGGKTWDNPEYGQWVIKSLGNIISDGGLEPVPTKRHSIPVVEQLEYPEKEHPIDPYTLGVLLGDGSIKTGCQITSDDPEVLDHIEWDYDRNKGIEYYFRGKLDKLREAGIYGMGCENKYVPGNYKHSNERLAVLQGLMDTDGYAGPSNCEFVSVSERLAQDVADICRSLGIRCNIKRKQTSWVYKGEKKYNIAYKVSIWNTDIPLFRLSRKANTQNFGVCKNGKENIIVKIEPVGKDFGRCIEIDSEDRTYIVADYCVTHNTLAGGYEVACHATGIYPHWWEGYRFENPVDVWVAGSTRETTRDAPQKEMLGPAGEIGTGMIPKRLIKKIEPWHGVAGSVGAVWVHHEPTGGISRIGFKTYDQKRRSFEGTAKHIIWFDEEPPEDIYNEALLRTMTTKGIMMSTLTPMQGLTEFIVHFQDTAQSFTEEKDG